MEPDVIRIYSSSPPPMEDGVEEEEDEFGDFGGFSAVPTSISFTEFETPTTFNQSQALNATSPPELLNNGGLARGLSGLGSPNGTHSAADELSKANGVVPGGCLDISLPERTVSSETKKVVSNSLGLLESIPAGSETTGCNGGSTEALTNGFATFENQGSPSLLNSVCSHQKRTSMEDRSSTPPGSPEDDFADFAAFSNDEGHVGPATDTSKNSDNPNGGSWLAGGACQEHSNIEQGITLEVDGRVAHRTGSITSGSDSLSLSADAADGLSNGDGSCDTDADSIQRDVALAGEPTTTGTVCTEQPLAVNRLSRDALEEAASGGGGIIGDNALSSEAAEDGEGGLSDGKGSGNETETETETETSFGRPLSTDALEEYGDMSTTGSVPSPPLQEETATPADHSQLAEDDEEDFGDFGDAASFTGQGFADFDQTKGQLEPSETADSAGKPETGVLEEKDDFGDFDTSKFHPGEGEFEDGDKFAEFPVSDSFGNFSTATVGADTGDGTEWSAFDEPEQGQEEGDSWATFGEEQRTADPPGKDEWQCSVSVMAPPTPGDQSSTRDCHSVSLSDRLERLFQNSFPETPVAQLREEVLPLRSLLEPQERLQPCQNDGTGSPQKGTLQMAVWWQLQDIHEAYGLRHQWGGSHSNKTLLCSLGIDTRNILFTGQKKQPVIVPMYAASLGMLEPTKEPVKPISAAEMIASIAQAPTAAPEQSTCTPDPTQQEVLPPIQFDWSSSGLTNPLDGVDPELYELTTAKLDPTGSGSRVADAFARLMSTMEKTSTSTRKPRKEENLSEEAAKVIASLPDLSFMQAKVLMFPTTLTPLGCSETTPD